MEQFDFNQTLEQIKQGVPIEGKDGVLAPLIKQLTEAALEAELESHLSQEIRNRKNGKSTKRIKSQAGEFELSVPRDRHGTFEPQIVRKHQTTLVTLSKRKFSPFTRRVTVTPKLPNISQKSMV